MSWLLAFGIGVVMIALGCFIGVRPMFTHNAPFTATRWLNIAFALFFLIRGTMNVKAALRRKAQQG